jgi:hypothetical protein
VLREAGKEVGERKGYERENPHDSLVWAALGILIEHNGGLIERIVAIAATYR